MPKLEIRNSKFVKAEPVALDSVRDFKDLLVWQLARELRILIYTLVKKFPTEERYALSTQMRRAAQSIGANIAEGFRRYSYRENIQFCRQQGVRLLRFETTLLRPPTQDSLRKRSMSKLTLWLSE